MSTMSTGSAGRPSWRRSSCPMGGRGTRRSWGCSSRTAPTSTWRTVTVCDRWPSPGTRSAGDRRDPGSRLSVGLADDLEVGQAGQHRLAAHAGSLKATVISSSLRVSFEVTTIPSPHRPWRTRSPSRNWRSPGMIGRGGLVDVAPPRPNEPDGAPASNASRRAARSRLGRNVSPSDGAPGRPLPCRYAGPAPRIGVLNRVVRRWPNTRSRSRSRSGSSMPPSRGPIMSSAGISNRNRLGTAA